MLNIATLSCARCGGPLSRPAAIPALIDCVFCGATISVGTERAIVSQEIVPDEVRQNRRMQFHEALVAALEAGTPPFDAVRDAARAHLELGDQSERAARVAVGLVRDFERDAQVEAVREPQVLARIVEAYLRALDELRTVDRYDLNLPFLTADATGPKHLRRTVTAQLFAQLAEAQLHEPAAPAAAAPAPSDPETAKKKRWWWPF